MNQQQKNRVIKATCDRIFAEITSEKARWDAVRKPLVEQMVAKYGAGWSNNRKARAHVSAGSIRARTRFFQRQRELYAELELIIESIMDGSYKPENESSPATVIKVDHWRRKGVWRIAEDGVWPSWVEEINIALWPWKTPRFVIKGCKAREGKQLTVQLNGRDVTFRPYPGSRWVRHRRVTTKNELRNWIPEAV